MRDIGSNVILTQAEEAEYSVIVNDQQIKDEMVTTISWFGLVAATHIMADRYNKLEIKKITTTVVIFY